MAITLKNLARLDAAIKAAGVAITGVNLSGIVTPPNLQTAAQPTINAFDSSVGADATYLAKQEKAKATAGIDAGSLQVGDMNQRLFVAVVGIILDEFNLHKDKINSILTAIDSSTTYGTLKSNIAAIPDYPTRTQAQLITALKAKITATAE